MRESWWILLKHRWCISTKHNRISVLEKNTAIIAALQEDHRSPIYIIENQYFSWRAERGKGGSGITQFINFAAQHLYLMWAVQQVSRMYEPRLKVQPHLVHATLRLIAVDAILRLVRQLSETQKHPEVFKHWSALKTVLPKSFYPK